MKIALLGDVSFNGKFDLESNPNAKKYFKEIRSFLKGFDYVIANLETPFTNQDFTLTCKGLHLKTSPINVELLKYLNINIVGLANNHIFDYGIHGYKDTINTLEKNEIKFYGVNNKQVFIEKEKNKIAISGYCCFSTNPNYCNDGRGVNLLDSKRILKNLEANKKENYLNIVSIHWGDEYIHYPRYDHMKLARFLADNYSIVLHGHHPHVIQGIEKYKSSFISYSLGNFCMDDIYSKVVKGLKVTQKASNKRSFILSLDIENNKINNTEIIPIEDNGKYIELGNQKIVDEIYKYSEVLKMEKFKYLAFREKEMKKLLIFKYQKRDLKWFVNRLNYYYIGAILKGVLNQRKYNFLLRNLREQIK